MKNYKLVWTLAILSLFGTALTPVFALAQTDQTAVVNAAADVTAGANAGGTTANVGVSVKLTAKLEASKAKADKEIDRRVQALTDLNARVALMQNVSADFKTGLSTAVQNQISAFSALKTKIDADDAEILKADIQTITQSYRIFALVLPQGRIAAAADRAVTIAAMMNTLGAKLQTRMQAAATAGADISAMQTALTDLAAKIADAQTQAQAAVNGTASLNPDNGDKTIMASNTTALKAGRTDIQTANKDLMAARKDIEIILKALKAAEVSGAASGSVQAQTP